MLFSVCLCFWHCASREIYTMLFPFSIPKICRSTAFCFSLYVINAGPPHPWFGFLVVFDFFHHGIEDVERHFLWKFHWNIQRESWSNALPKLFACIRFLYKVVHKIGRLRKFNRAWEIEFNFFTAWTIFMKLGTLVHHIHGYKKLSKIF